MPNSPSALLGRKLPKKAMALTATQTAPESAHRARRHRIPPGCTAEQTQYDKIRLSRNWRQNRGKTEKCKFGSRKEHEEKKRSLKREGRALPLLVPAVQHFKRIAAERNPEALGGPHQGAATILECGRIVGEDVSVVGAPKNGELPKGVAPTQRPARLPNQRRVGGRWRWR